MGDELRKIERGGFGDVDVFGVAAEGLARDRHLVEEADLRVPLLEGGKRFAVIARVRGVHHTDLRQIGELFRRLLRRRALRQRQLLCRVGKALSPDHDIPFQLDLLAQRFAQRQDLVITVGRRGVHPFQAGKVREAPDLLRGEIADGDLFGAVVVPRRADRDIPAHLKVRLRRDQRADLAIAVRRTGVHAVQVEKERKILHLFFAEIADGDRFRRAVIASLSDRDIPEHDTVRVASCDFVILPDADGPAPNVDGLPFLEKRSHNDVVMRVYVDKSPDRHRDQCQHGKQRRRASSPSAFPGSHSFSSGKVFLLL